MPLDTVHVTGLSFGYDRAGPWALRDVDLTLGEGHRCLVVGGNGAGKTTFLKVVAGHHMVSHGSVRILGRPAFDDCGLVEQVRFIGGVFPFDVDLTVEELLSRRPKEDESRRSRLVELLGIQLDWHMNRISDGQRRRVQLLLHLERPRQLLLLDEVTTDLDVVVRADLLELLRGDCTEHGTSILYATHIFDGLEDWATDLLLLEKGCVAWYGPLQQLTELESLRVMSLSSPLHRLVQRWIRFGYDSPQNT